MKVSVSRVSNDRYTIRFDSKGITVDGDTLRQLHQAVTPHVAKPGGAAPAAASADDRLHEVVSVLSRTGDLGIQRLLRMVPEDDVLVLLALVGEDSPLRGRIFGNMTERSRKMFEEDLSYKFHDGVPDAARLHAAARLAKALDEIQKK